MKQGEVDNIPCWRINSRDTMDDFLGDWRSIFMTMKHIICAHMTMKEYLWRLNQVVHLYDGNVYALHTLKKKCLGWYL